MSYWKNQAVLQAREVGEQRGGDAERGRRRAGQPRQGRKWSHSLQDQLHALEIAF